jgi:hypothetical protein
MELKDFIKNALSDIVQGVKEAGEELKDDVSMCQHTNMAYNGYPSMGYKVSLHEWQAPLTVVGFKVKVEARQGVTASGDMQASFINVVGGGMGAEATTATEAVQELSFSVPVMWKKREGK